MKNILSISVLILSIACGQPHSETNDEKGKVRKFSWLNGTWTNISAEGSLYEIWRPESDSTLEGISFMTSNNDTVFSEKMRIEFSNNECCYIPVVKNQNDGKPVIFKLISEIDGKYVFENPEHDFPQRIVYSNATTDSLHAWIDGMQNGKFREEHFYFVRGK